MFSEIYIVKRKRIRKKIGKFFHKGDKESIYKNLIRIFSLRKSIIDDNSIEAIVLFSNNEKRVIANDTLRRYIFPLSVYIFNLRNESVFNNDKAFFLSDLMEEDFNLDLLKNGTNKHIKMKIMAFYNFLKKTTNNVFRANLNIKINDKVQQKYNVYCYNIEIIRPPDYETKYYVKLFTDLADIILCYKSLGNIMIKYDRKYFLKKIAISDFDSIINHRLKIFRFLAERFCPDVLPMLSSCAVKNLAYLSVFSSLRVTRIMPFLLDDKVQEFFQDAPHTKIYLDHEDYGRCLSNIALSEKEVEAFLSHIKIDTGSFISFSSPSLKTDYVTSLFKTRIAIDVPPLTVDGVSIDVRKYRKKIFTLPELIKRKTLSSEAAAFLYITAFFRSNILISGEPGSGKTTLLNAIDIMLPKLYRKIYIEDVVESTKQLDKGFHQLRLRVTPVETSSYNRSSKSIEIIKVLHRKPDYVIMGELQQKDHIVAAFHAMNAGIKCIQTTHARDLKQLILRFVKIFGIFPELLTSIDIIVFMRRDLLRYDRKEVTHIYERSDVQDIDSPLAIFSPIYIRDSTGTLKRKVPIEESTVLKKISTENRIPLQRVVLLVKKVKSLLEEYANCNSTRLNNEILKILGMDSCPSLIF